jgi:predicted dehydrogenase
MVASRTRRRVRWGIIGCGAFGRRAVAPAIIKAAGGELVSIQRRKRSAAAETAQQLGLRHFCVDERDMLAGDLVDAVFIASSNAQHAPQTEQAARHGVNILVEKPMALDSVEARKMVRACKKAGVKLMVGQSSRFYDQTQKARVLVKQGVIGKPHMVHLFFTFIAKSSSRSWIRDRRLAGGGPLMDIGVHLLDNLCYVLDDKVVSVSALMQPTRSAKRVEEDCALNLKMKKGTMAQLYCSYSSPGSHHYRFLGSKGGLAMQMRPGAPLDLFVDHRLKRLRVGKYDHIRREVELFNKHLLSGAPNPVPGEEGLRNMQVIDAAYESAKLGQEVRVAY